MATFLLNIESSYAQQNFYNVSWKQSEYIELNDYELVYDGLGDVPFNSPVIYSYGYTLAFESLFYGLPLEEYNVRLGRGMFFDTPLANRPNSDFFSGPFENLTPFNPDRTTFVKRQTIDNDSTLALVIQFENLGLQYDLESDNPSDHYLNFQVWFHYNGDIELVFGPCDVSQSKYYSSREGFLNASLEPTGMPKVGISNPRNTDAFFDYLTGNYMDPTINSSVGNKDVFLGIPPEGWTVSWTDTLSTDLALDEVIRHNENGFVDFKYMESTPIWSAVSFDSTIFNHSTSEPPSFELFSPVPPTFTLSLIHI